MVETGNPSSVSDAAVGALCARSAIMGANLNVRTNTTTIKDRSFADDILKRGAEIEQRAIAAADQAARGIARQAADESEAARKAVDERFDEKLREVVANATAAAERVAQQAVESAAEALERPRADAESERSAAQSLVAEAAGAAESARVAFEKRIDEKLEDALAGIRASAQQAMVATLDTAKGQLGDASRDLLESARAELLESVRVTAQTAATPVAEAAARATIEEVARQTLEATRAEEAASRGRVEQATIAVAEKVGRELVQLAFSAASTPQKGMGGSLEAMPAAEEAPAVPAPEVAAVDGIEREHVPEAARETRRIPAGVLPWLGGLTLAVLYLLARSFL